MGAPPFTPASRRTGPDGSLVWPGSEWGEVVSGPVASLRRPQDPVLLLSNQSTTPVVFCDAGGGRPDVRPTPNRTIRLDPETVAALEAHRERQFVERDLA